jgi:hypothetical protein
MTRRSSTGTNLSIGTNGRRCVCSAGGRQESFSAFLLPHHPDKHRPKRPVLLAVDQQFSEVAALWVAPELTDPVGAAKIREAKDVHKFGPSRRREASRRAMSTASISSRVTRPTLVRIQGGPTRSPPATRQLRQPSELIDSCSEVDVTTELAFVCQFDGTAVVGDYLDVRGVAHSRARPVWRTSLRRTMQKQRFQTAEETHRRRATLRR